MERPEEQIISRTFSLVRKFGVRNFSMDMLVRETGIAKKTIYQYFSSKEDVLTESIMQLTGELETKNKMILESEENPVAKVIRIIDHHLSLGLSFRDSFLFEMKKYHSAVFHLINDYTEKLFESTIHSLLDDAAQKKMLVSDVDTKLFCGMHLAKIREIVAHADFYQMLGYRHVLRHLVVFPIRGILKPEYFEALDEWK